MSLKNCLIVLWVYIMYGLGIWVFFSGYLLKRIVIHKNNTETLNIGSGIVCGNYRSLHSISDMFKENPQVSKLKYPADSGVALKRYEKAVLIVIDALRYDFAVRDSGLSVKKRHYADKLPVFQDILDKSPGNGMLLKLFADPPTTTLQRLTGITTGSLPTFIDISLNFASTEIQEDNLIRQLNSLNKSVVFMGDDTWVSVFPNQFYRSYPFPSFDVKDLDTVDDGVLGKIYEELDKKDWDVLIAHFLGVDHCGHRYGPNHPAMSEKLQQMDNMIRNVTKKLDDNTMLFILGDHGMTESGDHGGDSEDEVSTVLFMYSSSGMRTTKDIKQGLSALQIDLVPTFAMLLGLPIPFSNLGSVVKEPFTLRSADSSTVCFSEAIDSLLGKTLAAAENAYQVHRYLETYTSSSKEMSQVVIDKAETLLKETFQLWSSVTSDEESTKYVLQTMLKNYESYLSFVQLECRKVWATFSIENMFLGSVILLISIILNCYLAGTIKIDYSSAKLFIPLFFCTAAAVALCMYNTYITLSLMMLMCYIFRTHVCNYLRIILHIIYNSAHVVSVIAFILFLSSFSNSFVVLEDFTLQFFVQSLVVYRFLPGVVSKIVARLTQERPKRTKHSVQKWGILNCVFPVVPFLGILLVVRLASLSHRCREEQLWCSKSVLFHDIQNLESSAQSSSSLFVQLCVMWSSVVFVVVAAVITANRVVPKKNYTAAMICINYGFVFCAIFVCLHWWLSVLPSAVLERILRGNEVVGARCAMAISLVMWGTSWVFPLLQEKPWESQTNHVFSGSLCLFTFTFLIPLFLTAGEKYALSITLMITTQAFFLYLDKLLPDSSESSLKLKVLIWYLLSSHWFYGTGHQPVFPAIQWDSAFVLTKGVSSYVVSGALVLFNTYSSQIAHGISLPLLLLWTEPPKDPSKPLLHLLLHYISLHGIKLLGSVLACFILRRHLMVWKIFTPKLIYEAIGFVVVMLSVFISYLFTLRVTSCFHKQIRKNINQLWYPKDQ